MSIKLNTINLRLNETYLDFIAHKTIELNPYSLTVHNTDTILESTISVPHYLRIISHDQYAILGGIVDKDYRGQVLILLHNLLDFNQILGTDFASLKIMKILENNKSDAGHDLCLNTFISIPSKSGKVIRTGIFVENSDLCSYFIAGRSGFCKKNDAHVSGYIDDNNEIVIKVVNLSIDKTIEIEPQHRFAQLIHHEKKHCTNELMWNTQLGVQIETIMNHFMRTCPLIIPSKSIIKICIPQFIIEDDLALRITTKKHSIMILNDVIEQRTKHIYVYNFSDEEINDCIKFYFAYEKTIVVSSLIYSDTFSETNRGTNGFGSSGL